MFDLDMTLVDSSLAEEHRRNRLWPRVYQTIPQFTQYEGIDEIIRMLVDNEVPVCIVTSSPSTYCVKVINHFGWDIANTVCYHDTNRRKPHPDPILAGLHRLQATGPDAISVGDNPNDIIASKAAGVFAVAATWGAPDKDALLQADPDAVAESPIVLRDLLIARLSQLAHLRGS
ncbi:MAG: HAD-IA family hydrolase [Armatimonas sp.]